MGYSKNHARASVTAVITGVLTRQEYKDLSDEQKTVRVNIGKLRKELYSAGAEERARRSVTSWNRRAVAMIELDECHKRYEELNELLSLHESERHAIIDQKMDKISATGISEVLMAAIDAIKSFYPQSADNFSDEHAELCGVLKRLAGHRSPLLNFVNRSEMDDLKAQLESDHRTTQKAARLAVSQLKAQIQELQATRGMGGKLLREIWERHYDEIDPHRVARGEVYRVHLTKEDARRIQDILDGIGE